jgi:hypothetical protein
VVQRTVGVDHRIFEQAVGIDVVQQSGHGDSAGSLYREGRLAARA